MTSPSTPPTCSRIGPTFWAIFSASPPARYVAGVDQAESADDRAVRVSTLELFFGLVAVLAAALIADRRRSNGR